MTNEPATPRLRIRTARVGLDMTQAEYAAHVGISKESLSLAERGITPGFEVQTKLAKALNCEPTDIWPAEREAA